MAVRVYSKKVFQAVENMLIQGMSEKEITGRMLAAHRSMDRDDVDYYIEIARVQILGEKRGKHMSMIGESTRQFSMWIRGKLKSEEEKVKTAEKKKELGKRQSPV